MSSKKLFIACALVVGCGSSADPVGNSSTTPPTSNAPGNEGPATPTREGHVSVLTSEASDNFGVTATASFGAKQDVPAVADGCAIVEDVPFAVDVPAPASDSAGTLDVDVLLGDELNVLKLSFDPMEKRYDTVHAYTEGHATGVIRIHAGGGDVPAFDAELPALSPVRVLSPAPNAPVGGRDLPVSWTFDGEDVPAIVYLQTGGKNVRCVATKGRELTIPAAVIDEALPTPGVARLMVFTIRTVNVDAGDYRIAISHNTSTHVEVTRE
jgi:hypothetical protein